MTITSLSHDYHMTVKSCTYEYSVTVYALFSHNQNSLMTINHITGQNNTACNKSWGEKWEQSYTIYSEKWDSEGLASFTSCEGVNWLSLLLPVSKQGPSGTKAISRLNSLTVSHSYPFHSGSTLVRLHQSSFTQDARQRSVASRWERTCTASSGGRVVRSGKLSS